MRRMMNRQIVLYHTSVLGTEISEFLSSNCCEVDLTRVDPCPKVNDKLRDLDSEAVKDSARLGYVTNIARKVLLGRRFMTSMT